MLRIAICDDMPEELLLARQIVSEWKKQTEPIIIETFQDADALINAHTGSAFDIILLDIMMPLLNGIEAARELRQTDRRVKIVFLTVSTDFAVESYTVKADNYLLKPLNREALHCCLDELYAEITAQEKYITVKGLNAVHQLAIRKIEYLEAQNKQVCFSLTDGSSIQAMQPLYSFQDKLFFADGFFKCHRSYLINMYQIETYTMKEIRMRSGCRIPISRSYHKEFEAAYFELMFGKAGDP